VSVKVLFFASLRDAVGRESLTLEISAAASVDQFMRQLETALSAAAYAALSSEAVRIAVNQELVQADVEIHDGDEVAFLPPVTGG
jgi:molybdopterin synthase sulfur carrier subunit